jgi:lauroyl/myristoyl acyltransferase
MTLRHALSWKPWFYRVLLPALGRLGPSRADASLASLGRTLLGLNPRGRRELDRQIARADDLLNAGWDRNAVRRELGAGILRTLARDYPLEGRCGEDEGLARRFDVTGFHSVRQALDGGRGLILLGSHLGAHLTGLHWMARRGLPLRLLVQRPRHVSPTLQGWFDAQSLPGTPLPQSEFFLRRNLDPGQAVRRVMLARDALRAGHLVYINGDVPWPIPSARPARFLGAVRPFLTLWADLAAQTGAAVVPLFCTHQPEGRYRLAFEPPRHVAPGSQPDHLSDYLTRLESQIAAHPGDAVPYLTWPTYTQPGPAPATLAPPNPHTLRRKTAILANAIETTTSKKTDIPPP